MSRMLKSSALVLMAVCLTSCLDYRQKTYRLHLPTGTGQITFVDMRGGESPIFSFATLVAEYLSGTGLAKELPRFQIEDIGLAPLPDRLDGEVQLSFESLESAGIYQKNPRSQLMYCVPANERVIETNGTSIEATMPGCVVWPKRTAQLELVTRQRNQNSEKFDEHESLLPTYREWVAAGSPEDVDTHPFFVTIHQHSRLETLVSNVNAIRSQELLHGKSHLEFLALPPTPRAAEAVDAEPNTWPNDTAYEALHWAPENRESVYGSYWVEVSEDGLDFTVHGMADLDGDGQSVHVTATRDGEAQKITAPGVL